MSEDPQTYVLKEQIHTAAVDAVVRFLNSMDKTTVEKAINIYLNK